MNRIIAFCFLIGIASQAGAQVSNSAYSTMLDALIDKTIPLISCEALASDMKKDRDLLILDTRSKNEFDVSKIPGAIHVGYKNFNSAAVDAYDKNRDVIVYCSVGYRSEKIGEQLKELGFKSVFNLHGGIFEWVNQGYNVVNEGNEETLKIHAYDKVWGIWLNKGEKVYND